MPLIVDGKTEDSRFRSSADFAKKYPHFKEIAEEFCKKPIRKTGSRGLLYVTQGEFATVARDDENVTVIGSEDATTCHIIVLQNTSSGVTSLGHFDGHDTCNGIKNMISSVKSSCPDHKSGQILLHLFGGFLDDRGTSNNLTTSILEIIQSQGEPIHLSSACVTEFNDRVEVGLHKPRIYGVGVTVQDGHIFPATFLDKGPDEFIRHARTFTAAENMVEIYNSSYKELRITPYEYKNDVIIPYIPFFLKASDEFILENLSTSPHCEPPDFVATIKGTLKHILSHPKPLVTVFPQGRPRIYKHQPGNECWAAAVDG